MKITCSNCDYIIETKYINLTKCVCPSCLKYLKVSKLAIILFLVILILPLIGILSLEQSLIFRSVWGGIWVAVAITIIKPKIYKYEVVEKNKLVI